MATFAEDATLNTYTYDSDGFKKVENVGGSLSTIIWDGTDYLQVRNQTSSTNKTFHTVESQMMSYIENTFRFDLLTDHLGSVTAIVDGSQIRIFDTRYSAYGRNLWSTGTGCGFGWVGSYGYRETGLFHMSHYVRARHYSSYVGNWSTVDPLWPPTSAYGYVLSQPTWLIDPAGLQGKPAIPPWLLPPAPRSKQKPVQGLPVPWKFPFPPVSSPKPRPVPHKEPWKGQTGGGTGWQYGAYCGSGNKRNPGWMVEPQDDLDACCQIHDRCLEAHYGAGFSGADGHNCCDEPLRKCADWAGRSGCLKAGTHKQISECIESAYWLRVGIKIGDWFENLGKPARKQPCLSPKDYPPFVEKHWGNETTPYPVGCGST